jgi:hypothetical protein
LQSSTLATKMLLLTTATAKALDQRNVVVYDALSDVQQKIHVIVITIISAYIAGFINLHSNGKSRKKTMVCVVFVRRLNDFVTSMMRE